MSITTDFITELVQAASDVERLDAYEMAHLLERSMMTIREMRASRGIRLKQPAMDPLIGMENVQDRVMRGIVVLDQVAAALSDASGMIRELHFTGYGG